MLDWLWINTTTETTRLRTAEPQRMPSRAAWSAKGSTDSQPNGQSADEKLRCCLNWEHDAADDIEDRR